MDEIKVINEIRKAASVLKDSKLKRIEKAAPALEKIRAALKLDSNEEAMILVAVLDRQCSSERSDLADLSDYFSCSMLDMAAFYPAMKALMAKDILTVLNRNEIHFAQNKFSIYQNVFSAIIEGREIPAAEKTADMKFDRFDLCEGVDSLAKERKEGESDTQELFANVAQMEQMHGDMEFVREVGALLPGIEDRTLFYIVCKDFNPNENGISDINVTLNDIYDRVPERGRVKKALIAGTHPIIASGLAELQGETGIGLTDKGADLFFVDLKSLYIKNKSGLDRYSFLESISDEADNVSSDHTIMDTIKLTKYVEDIERQNPQLGFIASLSQIVRDSRERMIFYLICNDMVNYDSYELEDLRRIMPKWMEISARRDFKNNRHTLQTAGLVTVKQDGFFEKANLEWTEKGKTMILGEDIDLFDGKLSDKNVIDSAKITQRRLFFEPDLQRQLSDLEACMQDSRYASICERMRAKGQPTGIAVLLYGAPGTGKTESVMQIARATGRAVMHVDISATKTCWFGESEKLIKEVFTNYRKLCDSSKLRPILLFNEADAVFSKRKDSNASNVAQTENAIQNIILEEMEHLDGILIATTNMADNLDPAFERRFLFKIRFGKTTEQARAAIWRDKIPSLSEMDARSLASAYDFSGGEIDNVARKAAMEEILNGTTPTVDSLTRICSTERISTGTTRKIGFGTA